MRRILSLTLFLCLVAFGAMAQEIVIADYEANSAYPDRTGGWNLNDISEGIDNPLMDDVNGSEKVASLFKSTQWSDAVQIFNFNEPISLGMYPVVKMKVLTETSASKKVSISLEDVNGFSQSVEVTLPEFSNSAWNDVVFDFSQKAVNTPISFIKSATIFFDYGTSEDMYISYYFDDIRFCGPKLEVNPVGVFNKFKEPFGGNKWENSNWDMGYVSQKGTIADLYANYSWGRGLTALQKHYNDEDSVRISWPFAWDAPIAAVELDSAGNYDFNYFNIKEIPISGYSDLSLSYDLMWKKDPLDYSQTPYVEFSTNGGANWTEAPTSTPDSLPVEMRVWGTGVSHPLTGASGKTLMIRFENKDEVAACFVSNIKVNAGLQVFVTSVEVSSDGNTIDVDGGTKQINATILPSNSPQDLYWTVISGDSAYIATHGKASISSTGLLTAQKNGPVSVIGRAWDLWGVFADTIDFELSNQFYPIDSIKINNGVDTIDTDNGIAVYSIDLFPSDPDTATYTVSLVDSLGNASYNAIFVNDTLTALKNGYVIIKVVADDYKKATGQRTIVLQNQEFLSVATIDVIGETSISVNGGTLQVSATVLPLDADYREVEWSIENQTGSATISETGLVQAVSNGTVAVIATALDGSGVSGSLQITITNQDDAITSKSVQKLQLYPNPVQQVLHINNLDSDVKVEVLNSLGTVVMKTSLVKNQSLNVQNLKQGLYIIRAISDKVVYQASFIKN